MARSLHRLSARTVQTVTATGRHADGGGLYLSVAANGGRRWVFLFSWQGKVREMGLGASRDVTLVEARRAATHAREHVRFGRDPIIERDRITAAIPTFGEMADELVKSMSSSWRNAKHRAQWTMTLTVYAEPLRAKSVADVTTEDVLAVLKPIWTTKPETANRTRGRIEAVLAAAGAKGHRSGTNPAQWRHHLDRLLPPRRKLSRGHHRALPYGEVPALVAKLRGTASVSARALEFTILTAARSGEVLGALWDEIDLAARVWAVPPERMKGDRLHRVPLPDGAAAILDEMTMGKRGDYVFPGARQGSGLSTMALAMALRRAGHAGCTVHGFRSAFRDWAAEETSFPRELAEAALAHLVGDETERAYRRGDALAKRRSLMDAWSAHCNGVSP